MALFFDRGGIVGKILSKHHSLFIQHGEALDVAILLTWLERHVWVRLDEVQDLRRSLQKGLELSSQLTIADIQICAFVRAGLLHLDLASLCLCLLSGPVVVISEVTRFTDAPGVQLAISVLTRGRHLVATLAVVAVFAHARCVVDSIGMRALGDLIAVLDLLGCRSFGQRFVNLGFTSFSFGLAYSFLCLGRLGLGLLGSLWLR